MKTFKAKIKYKDKIKTMLVSGENEESVIKEITDLYFKLFGDQSNNVEVELEERKNMERFLNYEVEYDRNNVLGYELKIDRLRRGLSQIELSKLTGVDAKTISLIEKGIRKKPKPETIFKLSKVLDFDEFNIMDYSGYTREEQIDYMKYMKGQKRIDFEYTITFKGHGMVYDVSKEDAEIYLKQAFEDITGNFEPEIDVPDEMIKLDYTNFTIKVDDKNENF